ncbi:MAG: Zn-ribbon containing protein [Halobellus sp.]|uniref:OapC/ArvC family zinc-ribbon domain-containing protein n=1 Tax=Halobellus sp. TaxID=1979212 RepID=UPI0035D4E3CF
MPHECTNCGRVFADGSKEMLSGCPNCGGNKFQFQPASETSFETDADTGTTTSRSSQPQDSSSTTDTHRDVSTTDTPGNPSTINTPSDASTTDSSEAWSEAADRALGDRSDPSADPADEQASATDPGSGTTRDPLASDREWPNQSNQSDPHGEAGDPSQPATPDDSTAQNSSSRSDSASPQSEPSPAQSDSALPADSTTESETTADSTTTDAPEDTAQANARSDVVSPDEIAAGAPDPNIDDPSDAEPTGEDARSRPSDADGRVIEPSSDDRPDLDDLREELNEQFESIRIVAPGEYELNLMELYDRTEYIISLQEDGRYIIEVPDTWDTTPGGPNDN